MIKDQKPRYEVPVLDGGTWSVRSDGEASDEFHLEHNFLVIDAEFLASDRIDN